MMCYVLYAQSESTSFAQTGRTLKWSHFSTRPGLSSPNDCNVWGSGMSGDIWYLMSSALLPLLSLASASAIVWVPPRPIDSGSRDERGYVLHRNDPKNTNISMIQVLHGCEFIYLCRLLCLIFDGKKHLEIWMNYLQRMNFPSYVWASTHLPFESILDSTCCKFGLGKKSW